MSIVVVVTAFPKPEYRADAVAAFEKTIARVHEEPGVELYALHEGPDRLVMIEKYASEQARSEHLQGAALADLRTALDGKLSSRLDAQVLEPHPAGNPRPGTLFDNTSSPREKYMITTDVRGSDTAGTPASRRST